MPVQAQYLAYVLEQLAGLGTLSARRMFGGIGLYSGELFFGLIDDDTLFFKTDESNHAEYAARNMPRFMPPTNRPVKPLGYHQVPADVIEDDEALVSWARKSVAVALASRARKAVRRTQAKVKPGATPKAGSNATPKPGPKPKPKLKPRRATKARAKAKPRRRR